MDRDTLIGITLISLILVVWMYWMAPPPEPAEQAQNAPPTEADTEAISPRQIEELPDLAETEEVAPGELGIDAPVEGEARTITVETDLYEAQFSTKGATLTSFILKQYEQFDEEVPVQLIYAQEAGALSLNFFSEAGRLIDTRNFYFSTPTEQSRIVVEDEPVELVFEVPIGENGGIRQTYTFTPGTYEVDLEVEFINPASFAEAEGYELTWHGGIPFTEGNATTEAQSSGAFALSGGEIVELTLSSEKENEIALPGSVEWTAAKSKFFTAVMIPNEPTEGGELSGLRIGELETPELWENYTTRLLMPDLTGEGDSFQLYLGPMEYDRISQYDLGLYGMVDYGYDFLEWFTRPLAEWVIIPTFQFLSRFIDNYGIIIIIFGILIKLLLYPLTKKSYKSMAQMSELQPKMQEIKEQYEDNPQKQQEAMMKLYKEAGVNPIGGCLPMLLQFPIIIALWRFFPNAIALRNESFLWANDLSSPDVILQLPFTIPFYGDFVAGFTLLMGLSMVVTMRIQSSSTAAGGQMKALQYLFPLMIFAIFNRFAAGLSLYYLVYNIVTAIQQIYIKREIHEDEEEEESPATGKNVQRGRRTRAQQT